MPHQVLPAIADAGIIATLRAPSAEAAYTAVDALVDAGLRAVEVTYTTPDAAAVIAGLADRFGDAVLLGAGTVTVPAQAREAAAAGAQFLVSPGYDAEVVDAITATGALSMIGGYTPTEVQRLRRIGVDVVKFFPGSIGGPAALRALRGPFPDLAYIPTGGVNVDNLGDWFAAGAVAVGAGSELLPAAALRDGDRQTLHDNAVRFGVALDLARGR